jgi:hypothetical protein
MRSIATTSSLRLDDLDFSVANWFGSSRRGQHPVPVLQHALDAAQQ